VIPARAENWSALQEFVRREFDEVWEAEAQRAVKGTRSRAYIAVRGSRVVGFACHGVYRADWFGPLGVAKSERGRGTGERLLRRCLDDLAATGFAEAQIGWIGPEQFYSNAVGARCERSFALLNKARSRTTEAHLSRISALHPPTQASAAGDNASGAIADSSMWTPRRMRA
jgi:predicted N-acetyltransferase YhbS